MTNPIVRSYAKSEMPRMQWTAARHLLFVMAVEFLGGERMATPKKIWMHMDERDLTISHVKSHLQMYRNMKEEESLEERRLMQQMNWMQYQHYLQIYERAANQFFQNQQRVQLESSNKSMEVVSCESLYQSSRVGLNENRDNDVVVAGDGADGEEELSLGLTLGLKY